MAEKHRKLIALNIILLSFIIGLSIGLFILYQNPAQTNNTSETLKIPNFGMDGLAYTDFEGKVLVLNLFASWCVPCAAEHPLLLDLAKKHNIPLYGMAVLDEKAETNAFIKKHGNPFITYGHDERGMMFAAINGKGVPETMIINGFTGEVIWRHQGPITKDIIKNDLLPTYNTALIRLNITSEQ